MNFCSRNLLKIARGCLLTLGVISSTLANAAEKKTRYMLEGISTPAVFAALTRISLRSSLLLSPEAVSAKERPPRF